MAEDETAQEGTGYERRDLSARSIALFGLALAIAILLSAAVVTLFQLYAGNRYARRQAPRPPLAVTREATEPRLQVNAPSELRTMREAEERTLGGYGWVDPQTETVRIPVERAMEILSQKGLPAREDKGKSQK
ncbi:MAG TPA: hypothetical protein VKH64_07785 [Candidatus Binatia bacterium]|nr:hypothetical protein [Candidatus Binatia bacterium]